MSKGTLKITISPRDMRRLRRSLEEFVIGGIDTTIPLHEKIVENSDFVNGDYDIHWLERFVAGD